MRTLTITAALSILVAPSSAWTAGPRSCLHFDVGTLDGFAPPTEPTFPSAALVTYTDTYWPQPTTRVCDSGGNDQALIHTFSGWHGPVCSALLRIELLGQSSSLSTNDSVRLGLTGDPDFQLEGFRYWTTIRFVTGSWGPGARAELELDLADLPPYVNFPTNILDELDDGELELLVEDDTAVDAARLIVCPCPPPETGEEPGREVTSVRAMSWGRTKAAYGTSPRPR